MEIYDVRRKLCGKFNYVFQICFHHSRGGGGWRSTIAKVHLVVVFAAGQDVKVCPGIVMVFGMFSGRSALQSSAEIMRLNAIKIYSRSGWLVQTRERYMRTDCAGCFTSGLLKSLNEEGNLGNMFDQCP